MRKKTNKALAILLTALFILTLLPAMALPVFAAEDDDDDGNEGIVVKVGVPGKELTYEMVDEMLGEAGLFRYDPDAFFSVIIVDEVTAIGERAFQYLRQLVNVSIPYSVQAIADHAFEGCSNLMSIELPGGLCSIGDYSFRDCTSLSKMYIPDSVNSIGQFPFGNCTSLDEISVNEDNKVYSSYNGVLFNKAMTELIFCPGGKTDAFVIPDGVHTILEYAFLENTGMESVTIPASVTEIQVYAFNHSFLCEIDVDEANPLFASIDGVLFSKDMTLLICCPGGKTGEYTVPDGVKTIGQYAFGPYVSSLSGVTIPESVTKIDDKAFYYLYGLRNLNLPDSITIIGKEAFAACTGITSLSIPSNLSTISEGAFRSWDSLTEVTIPENITTISNGAFTNSFNLKSVTFISANPPIPEVRYNFDSPFYMCPAMKVYVPTEGVDAYTALVGMVFPEGSEIIELGGTGHKHEYQVTVTAPTCTEQGYTTYICDCSESYYDDFTDALGHDWVLVGNDVATCTELGYEYYECSRCKLTKTEVIPALGHDFSILIDHKDATADEDGYDVLGCSRCDETKTVVIPAIGTVTVNGVIIFVKIWNDIPTLDMRELSSVQVSTIFRGLEKDITIDLSSQASADIYAEAGWFKDIDKTITIKTAKGDVTVKTKTLWNNSGKTRAIQIRDGSASIGNI